MVQSVESACNGYGQLAGENNNWQSSALAEDDGENMTNSKSIGLPNQTQLCKEEAKETGSNLR
jgi:hypothetical protein